MYKIILCCSFFFYVSGSSLFINSNGFSNQITSSIDNNGDLLYCSSSHSIEKKDKEVDNEYKNNKSFYDSTSLYSSKSFSYVQYNCQTKIITEKNISITQSGSVKKNGNIGVGQTTSSFPTNNANSSNIFRDNRVDVDFINMSKYQASAVSIFESKNYNYENCVSSSFLIWNGMVVTSAHSVLSHKIFNTNMEVGFVPNDISNRLSVTQICQVKNVYVPYDFYNSGCYFNSMSEIEKNNDWALLELDVNNIQNTYGSLTIGSNYTLGDVYYNSIGFPFDDQFKMQSSFAKYSRSYDSNKYTLYSYITNGMSGGPVIGHYFDNETLEDYDVCVGINSYNVFYNNTMIYSGANMISNNLICLADFII